MRVLDIDVDGAGGAGVEVVAGDIRDPAVVRTAVDGVDVVYHNVAQVPLARDPQLLRTVNVDGTQVLLDACRRRRRGQGRAHVVERGVRRARVQPGAARPRCPSRRRPTAHAKLAAEWACLRAAADGLDVTIVRPRTILGHGRLGIFGILFDWIADGADPIVLGDGSNRYQFVHADDLAEVCLLAAEQRAARRCSTPAPTASARCARRSSTSAPTPAPAPRCARCPAGPAAAAMRASAALGLTPFAPYHWLMYARSMWFDIDHVRDAPRLGAALVDRRDARPELRLVPRQPRRTPPTATGSPHRRTAKAGALGPAQARDPPAPMADTSERATSVGGPTGLREP